VIGKDSTVGSERNVINIVVAKLSIYLHNGPYLWVAIFQSQPILDEFG
jgi:hypothetical protein